MQFHYHADYHVDYVNYILQYHMKIGRTRWKDIILSLNKLIVSMNGLEQTRITLPAKKTADMWNFQVAWLYLSFAKCDKLYV